MNDQTENFTSRTRHLLRGLNGPQHQAVTTDSRHLRILAGAGSGKTRVLTHRIAYRSAIETLSADHVLAVTFTRKAAGELRERLGALGLRRGIHAGTFHAIAYAQLHSRWVERGVTPPSLLDRKVGFVARLMQTRDSTTPLDVVSEIEWAAARCIEPQDYAVAAQQAHREPPLPFEEIADIYTRYMAEKLKRRMVDFDDILRLATRDIHADPVYAAAIHWRYRHVFVDEFQDVNTLQFRLLQAWLGPDSDVCIVGDPNQAIYAWNGADARFILDFEKHFPGAQSVTLEDNYRSSPQILAVANAVLQSGPHTPMQLKAHRPDGDLPTVTAASSGEEEARRTARAIRDAHAPGTPWSHQAVLVRTNAQATIVAEACANVGIPHRVRGGANLLQQAEVKSALGDLDRARSLDIGLSDLQSLVVQLEAQRPATTNVTTDDHDPQLDGPRLTADRVANLADLLRLGREYVALDPAATAKSFRTWLQSAVTGTDDRLENVVDIMTFHAAKGLEWPIVYILGLEDGFVPISYTREIPEGIEEERRLLYVALTRAQSQLHLSWAEQRDFGVRTAKRKPSPWLDVINAVLSVGTHEKRTSSPAADAAKLRATLEKKRSSRRASAPLDFDNQPDELLAQALRDWRKQRSQALKVPAYILFNNETLRHIVLQRPASIEELLDVPGIGRVKAEEHGEAILEIVASTTDDD